MPLVESSALSHISYDAEMRALRAVFRESGKTYIYQNVPPDIYDALLAAPSLGVYFNAHIRDHFPFQEIPAARFWYRRR